MLWLTLEHLLRLSPLLVSHFRQWWRDELELEQHKSSLNQLGVFLNILKITTLKRVYPSSSFWIHPSIHVNIYIFTCKASIYTHTRFKGTASLHLQNIVFPRSAKALPHISAVRKLHTDDTLFPHCLSHNLWIFPQKENTVLYCAAFPRSRCRELRTVLYVWAVCDRDTAGSTGEGARGKAQTGSTAEAECRCPSFSASLVHHQRQHITRVVTGKLLKRKQAPFFMLYKYLSTHFP